MVVKQKKPEDIVLKLRQVDVLRGQGKSVLRFRPNIDGANNMGYESRSDETAEGA